MSQKLENMLNLALEADQEERENSQELDIGYDREEQEWELIVRYSGSSENMKRAAISVTELLGGYAVVLIKENRISELASLPEVEFIEKPKSLYFQSDIGRQTSCIDTVQSGPFMLSGRGVLVGIVDSGIDYTHPAFRNEDGTTRIAYIWDQTAGGNPPAGYAQGSEYTAEQINRALKESDPLLRRQIVPAGDLTGHGTAVAGIAAGNGRESEGNRYRGAAPGAQIISVRMGIPKSEGFPRTTELMTGVDYIIRRAIEMRMPVAINISFGNTYGSHDGTSLVERYLDDAASVWKSVICIGSGNEGTTAGHAAGRVRPGEEKIIQLAVQPPETSFSVQIWKSYTDEMDISIISPSGERVGPLREILGPQRFMLGGTELLLYYGEPKPYSVRQEIYIVFLPVRSYVDSGVWQIILTPIKIVSGEYDMWLPAQTALNVGTAFLTPDSSDTLTIPSTASLAVTVAAYDARRFSYADFSGRGKMRNGETGTGLKPDIAAPGVDVTAPAAGGGYRSFTGTSFAAPFVTGSAALLMEWGIIQGKDPYLYGEKVKAYLRRGARQIPGYDVWPNSRLGYGILCVRDSIPQ